MDEYGDAVGGNVDKITVSLPAGTKAALQAAVEAGRAPSMSALVAEAVSGILDGEREQQLARERTRQKIMELRGGKPFPPEAIAWARKALGVEDDATQQGQGAA